MLGCKYPIILGAFEGYNNMKLTATISEAGGCGVLTASYFKNEDEFKDAIQYIKNTTKFPFGINFSASSNVKSEKIFFRFLNVAKEEGVKIVTTAASRMESFGKQVHDNEMIWIHKATTMRHAISGEKMGADAVILTGLEGGGLKNPNQNTFLINMVNANRLLKKPVIASGGISNGRGLLAALILGAQAIHSCTAFLATTESPIPEAWKQRIIETDCFDPQFIKKVCHFTSNKPSYTDISMAAGPIKKIISAKELVNNIIGEAESILKNLGFEKNVIDFSDLSDIF